MTVGAGEAAAELVRSHSRGDTSLSWKTRGGSLLPLRSGSCADRRGSAPRDVVNALTIRLARPRRSPVTWRLSAPPRRALDRLPDLGMRVVTAESVGDGECGCPQSSGSSRWPSSATAAMICAGPAIAALRHLLGQPGVLDDDEGVYHPGLRSWRDVTGRAPDRRDTGAIRQRGGAHQRPVDDLRAAGRAAVAREIAVTRLRGLRRPRFATRVAGSTPPRPLGVPPVCATERRGAPAPLRARSAGGLPASGARDCSGWGGIGSGRETRLDRAVPCTSAAGPGT